MIRRLVAALSVTLLAVVGLAPPAGADDLTITDPAADVAGIDSGESRAEPRVDITSVAVQHEARLLRVTVTVAQFTPLDDPLWQDRMGLSVALIDGRSEDTSFPGFLWLFAPDADGAPLGVLLSLDDEFRECLTDASADEATKQYVLTADESCLRGVPRSLGVDASMGFDPQPADPDFTDFSVDSAPDAGFSAPVRSSGAAELTRIAGRDRIDTAIALSKDQFTEDGTAFAAVLASSESFPDAIAGGPVAAVDGGPLLLTGRTKLDPRVSAELQRAVAPGSDVFLLGGTGALSESVVTSLRELGFRPRRLAGANRFETAVAIADELGDHQLVVIADGRSFREGLIAAAAAAALGGVVVLSDGASLPKATDDFLANDPTRHIAIGRAAAAAPGAERIVAASSAELSQKVLDRLLPDVSLVAVAGQSTFADALAGAPHLASLGGGLLLTDSATLSPPTAAELQQRKDDLREVVLYGGTAAISDGVERAIRTALGG